MKCDTCDQVFPDSSVKVWNGKRVCPSCFQTLAQLPATTSESKVPVRPVEPAFRIDPAAYIDGKYASGLDTFWAAGMTDLLAIAKKAYDSGKREISAGEAGQWGAFLAINIKSRITRILAEDLGMPISDFQAFTIAANYLSGVHSASGARMSGVCSASGVRMVADICACRPLTEDERRVAEEIGYHALKAFTTHEKTNYLLTEQRLRSLTEQQLRSLTSQVIAVGENCYRKDWKSAFNGTHQMVKDLAYGANARAVEALIDFAQGLPAAYSKYGASLGLHQ